MRDLGITVVVALLIVLAAVRFWGYQKSLIEVGPGRGEDVQTNTITDTNYPPASTTDTETKDDTTAPVTTPVVNTNTNDPSISVADQPAGMSVTVESLTIPTESLWVAVHDGNRTLGALFVAKGTTSTKVDLLRATVAGHKYTVTLHKDNGDHVYTNAGDLPVIGSTGAVVSYSFTAQ